MSFRVVLFLCFFLLAGDAFTQQLDPTEKVIFDQVVFHRRKVGEYAVISKWVMPIRYKIYGDTVKYLHKEIDSAFSQLRRLTHLTIEKTDDDAAVNFSVSIVDNESNMALLGNGNNKLVNSPGYYSIRSNLKNEINAGIVAINIQKQKNSSSARSQVKKLMLKCLGFLETTQLMPNSLFNSKNYSIKISDFDAHIIMALYQENIKPGMTKDDVDAILKAN